MRRSAPFDDPAALPPQDPRVAAAVVVPARDEEAALSACLDALARQFGPDGRPLDPASYEILLLLNNCRDRSADVAAAVAGRSPVRVHVIEAELPPGLAHVGTARRRLMDAAARRFRERGRDDGLVLSTDADTRAAPDWIAANAAAVAAGADAVAGVLVPDDAGIGGPSRAGIVVRRRYALLADALAARLDPEPFDPWPRHPFEGGASLGVTAGAYAKAGGLPPLPVGEDVALLDAVRRGGGRVRHCPRVRVVTSARTIGRARGGMADTLRRWGEADGGEAVETAFSVGRRLLLRRAARRLHDHGAGSCPASAERLIRLTGWDRARLAGMIRTAPDLDGLLAAVAAGSRGGLAPVRAAAACLPREIAAFERRLAALGMPGVAL